jgi:hypothetical protein
VAGVETVRGERDGRSMLALTISFLADHSCRLMRPSEGRTIGRAFIRTYRKGLLFEMGSRRAPVTGIIRLVVADEDIRADGFERRAGEICAG